MFTQDERRALVFLAVITAVGAAFRVVRTAGAPGAESDPGVVAPALAGADIVRQAEQSRRAEELARPLGPGERVDVDRAGLDELQRLPRVGRALAQRILDERDAHGPFGSLAGLRRVSGVGPRMLRELESRVTFGGVAPAAGAAEQAATAGAGGAAGVPPAAPPAGRQPPALWVGRAADAPAGGQARVSGCARAPDLNHAGAADLACLPGIGPVLAERIVAERTAHGPFRELADLTRVPGLGRARVERLRDLVTIP